MTCKTCNNTGLCPRCRGAGCSDCYYTGECLGCQKPPDLRLMQDDDHPRRLKSVGYVVTE